MDNTLLHTPSTILKHQIRTHSDTMIAYGSEDQLKSEIGGDNYLINIPYELSEFWSHQHPGNR